MNKQRGTHILLVQRVSGISQNTIRKGAREWYPPTGKPREGPIRTPIESGRARGTHILWSAERGTKSVQQRRVTVRGVLTFLTAQRERQVRTQRESEMGRRTHILESTRERRIELLGKEDKKSRLDSHPFMSRG